jgi:SSS family solute:Na+ symporter
MNIIDILIISLYLIIIGCVGLYTRKYVSDFSDFMVAGRKMNLSLAVVTMLGTELGLITVMYNSQAGVLNLFSAFHIGLAAFLVTFLIGLSGFVIVKLRSLKVKSIPEYYEIRFGKKVRILGAVMLCFGGILNMGLFLKVGAIFVQTIFGLDDSVMIFIMGMLLLLVLFYTISGGMMSVVVTDYIQYVVLSFGFLFCIFYSFKTLGWSNIFLRLENIKDYDQIYNPVKNLGPAYISWQVVLGFVSAVIWPTAITRALSIKSVNMVKKQYLWSSFSFLIRFIIPCFIGICAFVYYDGVFENNTLALMPQYLSEILPIGVLGLVVAGMLAAFMSTHDSYLLCWSTIITNDIIEPLSGEKMSSNKKINISRCIIVLLGIYIFYWGMFYEGSDAIWDYLGITGAIYFTGAISVVVLGLYWDKSSSTGATLALLGGLSSIVGLEPIRNAIGLNVSTPALIGLCTLGLSVFLMIVGSILFPDRESKVKI